MKMSTSGGEVREWVGLREEPMFVELFVFETKAIDYKIGAWDDMKIWVAVHQ